MGCVNDISFTRFTVTSGIVGFQVCHIKFISFMWFIDHVKSWIKNIFFLSTENGFVEYDEFLHMMQRWHQNVQIEGAEGPSTVTDHTDEKRKIEAFKVFDMDCNGFIDKHEFRYTMTRLGENLSEEDIKAMFKEADLNGDGLIDYKGIIHIVVICKLGLLLVFVSRIMAALGFLTELTFRSLYFKVDWIDLLNGEFFVLVKDISIISRPHQL